MDYAPEARIVGSSRRKGGAMTGGVSSVIRSPEVHMAKMELAQHRAMEGYGATPAQRHRANQKATHRHMMGSASTGGATTGGFGAMDLIFPAHSLFGFGHQGGAMTGGSIWDDIKSGNVNVNGLAPNHIFEPPMLGRLPTRVGRDDLPRLITEPNLERNLKRTIGLGGASTGGASTGGMLYHGMPHPTMKGLRWCEHPQAVSGGFWLWDKIKEGANTVYNNVIKPVGRIARNFVAPVGNLIGTEFGVPIAGTLADQGLKAIGLGRRRRGAQTSMYPHGMRHPHYEGISWHHHPHALHGGFWLWDKIKEGANWAGDKIRQGIDYVGDHIGDLARRAVEPVGNFIGNQLGIENAGTTINSGLNAVGLGRRRGRKTASREHRREGELLHEAMEAHQAEGRAMRGGTRAKAVSARLGITPDGDYAFDSHIGGASTGGRRRRGGKSLLGMFGSYMGKQLTDPNSLLGATARGVVNNAGVLSKILTADLSGYKNHHIGSGGASTGGASTGGASTGGRRKASGQTDKRKERGELLRKVMASAKAHGEPITLPQASKQIKEYGLTLANFM